MPGGTPWTKLFTVRQLLRSRMFAPIRPVKLVRILRALRRWGLTLAAGYTVASIRYPDDIAIIDELGSLSFAEVQRRTNALAHAWHDEGLRAGDSIAILCRNHRGYVDASVACSKLGAHTLLLNTAFAGPQVSEICAHEQSAAIVFDEEFSAIAEAAARGRLAYVAWSDGDRPPAVTRLEELIARGDHRDLFPPVHKGRTVILTSGTTGAPKGANRKQPKSLDPVAALLSKIPLQARQRTLIAAPMFHTWGLAHFILATGLSSTLVLRRRFDPHGTLRAIDEHRCTALVVVPVMLQRMLELGSEVVSGYDTSSLRVIAASGSAFPGELATRVMDTFGDVLFNLYGSTECAWATVATPQELRAAPGTAGRPPRGTIVRLYDGNGREVAPGATGRIYVGNELVFEGYTGGGGKPAIGGLLASGDVGHFDEAGRLYIDGRDDEMIISGGENVFPREVEDVIARMDGVEEVAIIGVQDADFGQRLRAFVVSSPGVQLGEREIKEHVRHSLARYKIPRDVVFLSELPRNATGKIVRRELGNH